MITEILLLLVIFLAISVALLLWQYRKLRKMLTQDSLEFYLKEIDKRGFDVSLKPKKGHTVK